MVEIRASGQLATVVGNGVVSDINHGDGKCLIGTALLILTAAWVSIGDSIAQPDERLAGQPGQLWPEVSFPARNGPAPSRFSRSATGQIDTMAVRMRFLAIGEWINQGPPPNPDCLREEAKSDSNELTHQYSEHTYRD